MSRNIALYIHIPFCRRKCHYCSFVSYAGREAAIPAYVKALKAEITHRSRNEIVTSIYIGGGTPSLLSIRQVSGILDTVRSTFTVDIQVEISIEANPGTIDLDYLFKLRALGVNRLSLGIQSLNEAELAMLGRIHTAAEAVETVRAAREAGFDNLNLDLIYGLPGKSADDWRCNLEEVVALAPEHISAYALTLDENTPMFRDIGAGKLPSPDPDIAADHYEMAESFLSELGYRHYEISNWALPGRECRHNLVYWRNEPYLGIGVAAHTCLDGHRTANTSSLDLYLDGNLPDIRELDEEIDSDLELAESVILGLRLFDGISFRDIARRFGRDAMIKYRPRIEEMAGYGLLELTGESLRLTGRGRLLSNEVFWRFLPD